MSTFGNFVTGLIRDHAAKIVLGIFSLMLVVFPAVGSRVQSLKQPTADYVALLVNTVMPHEQQIGAADLPNGGVVLTQEVVADEANEK
jgi:hypothetical protein